MLECWRVVIKLAPPPIAGINQQSEILVTSLRWASKHSENALLVAYMYHGIVYVFPLEAVRLPTSLQFLAAYGMQHTLKL